MSWSGFRAVHLTAVPCCFLKTVIYASHVTEEKKQGLNPELQALFTAILLIVDIFLVELFTSLDQTYISGCNG